MTLVLVGVLGGAIGLGVSARVVGTAAARAVLPKRNYRGIPVSSVAGIAVVLGTIGGCGAVALLRVIWPGWTSVRAVELLSAVALAGGFGLLGLWDDVGGGAGERGWRAHVGALFRLRPTSGAIKLAGGAALALVVATASSRGWRSLVDGAVIALSANLWNLLDLRPGRACKFYALAAVPLMIPAGAAVIPLAAGMGATVGFVGFDLRERAMLGDTGANALGALVGWGILAAGSPDVRIGSLVVLVAIHALADRPGLSRIIEVLPPLRAFDRVGRVGEEPRLARGNGRDEGTLLD